MAFESNTTATTCTCTLYFIKYCVCDLAMCLLYWYAKFLECKKNKAKMEENDKPKVLAVTHCLCFCFCIIESKVFFLCAYVIISDY